MEVNSSQVSGTNKSMFETLQSAINDYMNTTVFTNSQFAANEKIECRLFFTIKEVDNDKLIGDLQVQSTRPVYNTNYTTTLINFKDSKIEFQYQEGEPLIFNIQSMESQLTAILNFYAYLILAVDFDSFLSQGRRAILRQAQNHSTAGTVVGRKRMESLRGHQEPLGSTKLVHRAGNLRNPRTDIRLPSQRPRRNEP